MNSLSVHTFDTTAESLGVDPALVLATVYRRVVNASIKRIWENVFDWEHLPVLHETYFNAVELLDRHPSGWRVRLSRQPGNAGRVQVLELFADRVNARYRVRTLEGTGTGTEIWTQLKMLAPHATAIEVRYYLPERRPGKVDVLGEKYRCSCQQLWSEDEAMMMHREMMLCRATAPVDPVATRSNASRDVDGAAAVPGVAGVAEVAAFAEAAPAPVDLGPVAQVRASLPLHTEFGGHPFRVLELDGELIAHSTVCPHWLGPLDRQLPVYGCLTCPWHGYRFDVRTGKSVDGHDALQLRPAPRVVVDVGADRVTLVAAAPV